MEVCREVMEHCAREYLGHIRRQTLRCEALRDEIEHQRAMLGPRSQHLSERVSGSRSADRFESGVIRLQELIEEYDTELAEYVEEQREAHRAIASLENGTYAAVLTEYYLQGKTWEEVARATSYSVKGAYVLRSNAAVALFDHLPIEWKRLPQAV